MRVCEREWRSPFKLLVSRSNQSPHFLSFPRSFKVLVITCNPIVVYGDTLQHVRTYISFIDLLCLILLGLQPITGAELRSVHIPYQIYAKNNYISITEDKLKILSDLRGF